MSVPSATGAATTLTPWDDGLNVEGDPALLGNDGPVRHFLRSHFPIPDLHAATYRLRVAGAVARDLELSLDDLLSLPAVERTVAMECAGNGRGLAATAVPGVQWIGGAVGRARWSGVPLADVLASAGLDAAARRVLLGGADAGEVAGVGEVAFERGLPLGKAMDGTVLLATAMDGGPIPREHGGPVRAIVPGWYGVASVKWLTSVTVLTEERLTHWETADYSIRDRSDGRDGTRPLTVMLPKAQIVRPARGATVPAGAVRVSGLAWGGEQDVAAVELSADGGRTWRPVTLDATPAAHDWVGWHADVTLPPGEHRLAVRCIDAAGASQPAERDPDRGRYLFNEIVLHPVVAASEEVPA